MKLKHIFSLTLLFGLLFCFVSCKEKAENKGPEYTSAYVCPMHCEGSGSAQPGKCPACKMDYVKNANYKGEHKADDPKGHDHGDHEGHNHGDHDGHDHEGHDHHGHDHDHHGHDHGDHEGHNH